ncbi:MAG: PEFG-CTERM sorting domain-containing protein, partial [Nitrosarchaeum sp.]|nr:PEFG-CTERM sorting domain-containing protein [Nitrosarchaeum sp.]
MISTSQFVFAESDQDKLSFASSLEETLGHFWALENNLDEKNAELALVHATHPISELYESMKPT